jgi:hypothetical protein
MEAKKDDELDKEVCFGLLQFMVDNHVKCQKDLHDVAQFMIKRPVNWEMLTKEQLVDEYLTSKNIK